MQEKSRVQWVLKRLPQLIAVLAASLVNVSDGMHYGWTAPAIPILESDSTPVPITHDDEPWIENIYNFGALAGLLVTVWIVDVFGRKWALICAGGMHLTSWLMIAFATRLELILAARFLSGLAGDVTFVGVPMYIAEIAEKDIRGFLGSFIFINMMVGIVAIYSIAPFTTITVSSSIAAGIVAVQMLIFLFMPETPYLYLMKGKQNEAMKSLQRLRNTDDIKEELEEIAQAVARQKEEKGRPKELLTVKSNRKALTIMVTLNFAQHFGGISVFFMNVHSILSEAESALPEEYASIIVAAIMLSGCIVFSMINDKFGRKKLLFTSCILTGISLLILASYFTVKNSGTDISSWNWIPTASVIMYALVVKFGLGMVPIVTSGEIFPVSVKAVGMTICDILYGCFSAASIYVYIYMSRYFGMQVPFFIFGGCCFFTAIFTIFYMPETKGRTLDEIQMLLKGHKF